MCYTEEFLFVSLLFTGISMSDSNFSSLLDPFERIGNYSNDAESVSWEIQKQNFCLIFN